MTKISMNEKTRQYLAETHKWTQEELDRCLRFWLNHGVDRQHGGMYTCLDRTGQLYSTDKSVWMQGRTAWTFSYLCNIYGEREEWRATAESCLDFLERYCFNPKVPSRLLFTVTGDGRPLRQRRYHASEGFYAMANAEYYLLTGKPEHLERARRAYNLIWDLNHGAPDPTGLGPKTEPETRQMRALGSPMIYLNLTAVMRRADSDPAANEIYSSRAAECVRDIVTYHYRPDLKCTLEAVGLNGEFYDKFSAGRVVNPGHSIECAWFMMEEANRIGDGQLYETAENILKDAYELGWDKEFGGLLYMVDMMGWPPEPYEHDMKLWWPHNETLIAALMAYRDTGKAEYLEMFEETLTYSQRVFSDPEYGEWFGYLRRDGRPTEPPSKGTIYKGPFHLPRMLIIVEQIIAELLGA